MGGKTGWIKAKERVLDWLLVPAGIRQDFLHESVRKNDLSMIVICGIILVVELYNLARVLFWSASGLRTLNNRIYFGAYCVLLAVAVLWLCLRRKLHRTAVRTQLYVHYGMVMLLFAWHVLLNAYDLYRNSSSGVIIFITAVLGLAIFIQMQPWYSLLSFGLGYLLFQLLAAPLLSAGEELNLTISFLVALAVSVTNAHHAAVNLLQRQQITQINQKLREMIEQDPLTGLLNKITIEHRTEQLLQDMGQDSGLTLYIIDLDDFKSVNDQYGHPCGDYVLKEMAGRLREVFAGAAGIGRIGGDEFAVLMARPLTQQQALGLGEQIIGALRDIQWQRQTVVVRCSVGTCVCTEKNMSYSALYAQTDRMLYLAKRSGKGRCCYTCICGAGAASRVRARG